MSDHPLPKVPNFKARLPCSIAPFSLFSIEDEVLTESANGLNRRSSDQQAAPAQPSNLNDFVVVPKALGGYHSPSLERQDSGGETPQHQSDRGCLISLALERRIEVEYPRTNHRRFRVDLQEGNQRYNRVALGYCVAVQQQQIPASRYCKRLVVCLCETQVFGITNEDHIGETEPHHLRTSIFGSVVHNEDLVAHAKVTTCEGLQALCEEVPSIERDNDDG